MDPLAKYYKSGDQENAVTSLVWPSRDSFKINLSSLESIDQSFNTKSFKQLDTNKLTLAQYISSEIFES